MRVQTLLLLLFSIICFASTNAIAEDVSSSSENSESFHLTGLIILGFSLMGWTFILTLLFIAIMKIVKKTKKQPVPEFPLRCK